VAGGATRSGGGRHPMVDGATRLEAGWQFDRQGVIARLSFAAITEVLEFCPGWCRHLPHESSSQRSRNMISEGHLEYKNTSGRVDESIGSRFLLTSYLGEKDGNSRTGDWMCDGRQFQRRVSFTLFILDGKFHDQGDAKWIVIRGQLRGHNDTPFGRPTPSRPIRATRGGLAAQRAYFWWFNLLSISNVN
jgi:hypothetical protein